MSINGINCHNSDNILTKSLRTLIRIPDWVNIPSSFYSLPPLFPREEKAKQDVLREMKSELDYFLPNSDYVIKLLEMRIAYLMLLH
jgi:hypothetical protein